MNDRAARRLDVTVRVYGPLNDFLPAPRRQAAWRYAGDGTRSVKDLIESLGVPHTEIDLIIVNGISVAFDHALRDGDRIAVFPRFLSLDVGAVTRVRVPVPDPVRFVVDVHLGTLARYLRLLGLDTVYRSDADDESIAAVAHREGRIVLTRDAGLLKRRIVTHGCFLRSTRPREQLIEVLRRFGPFDLQPFTRCIRCNGPLRSVPKDAVVAMLQPATREHFDHFDQCSDCGRVYWKGSHWTRLTRIVDAAIGDSVA